MRPTSEVRGATSWGAPSRRVPVRACCPSAPRRMRVGDCPRISLVASEFHLCNLLDPWRSDRLWGSFPLCVSMPRSLALAPIFLAAATIAHQAAERAVSNARLFFHWYRFEYFFCLSHAEPHSAMYYRLVNRRPDFWGGGGCRHQKRPPL